MLWQQNIGEMLKITKNPISKRYLMVAETAHDKSKKKAKYDA